MRDLTRTLASVAGDRKAGRTQATLTAIAGAERALLGPMGAVVPRVDAETAAQMLGEPLRIAAYARLLHERAGASTGAEADALAARAAHMAAAARTRSPADDPGVEEFIGGWS